MTWIEYDYVCNESKGIVYHKKVEYNEANLAIAQQEAVDGNYTITEDEEVIETKPLAVELGGTNAKTAEEACKNVGGINTYVHSSNGLAGMGTNGKFKATTDGTISAIKVNGVNHLVKCGAEPSMELIDGCWYTFILDGNTVNFNTGGAGANLNFKLVGGTTEPASPSENMIWVDTDAEITSWVFSATQPLLDGEDLYATAEKKAGYYLDASGNEVKNEDHEILTIDLPEGTTHIIVTGAHYVTSTVAHCFYGASGNFISSVLRNNGTFEYAVPSEAKSVRVTLKPDDTRSVIVCDSSKQEGMVWISIGTSSYTDFNALKKNGIMVYPLAVKQYIGGAWVGKSAKIYQGGAWVDLRDGELYYNGEEYTDITGGWVDRTSHDGSWYTNGVIEKLPNSIRLLCATQKKIVAIGPASAVDLTEYSTIKINVTAISTATSMHGRLAIRNVLPVQMEKTDAKVQIESVGIHSLDVSALSGKYYISMMGWGDQNQYGEIQFDKVWME